MFRSDSHLPFRVPLKVQCCRTCNEKRLLHTKEWYFVVSFNFFFSFSLSKKETRNKWACVYHNLHIYFVLGVCAIEGQRGCNFQLLYHRIKIYIHVVNVMYMRVTSWILKHIFIVETVHMHVLPLIPNDTWKIPIRVGARTKCQCEWILDGTYGYRLYHCVHYMIYTYEIYIFLRWSRSNYSLERTF